MLNADGMIAMLKAMNPKARKVLLANMDEQSKVSIVLMDLYQRISTLCNALDMNAFTIMKIPAMLSTIVIDSIDNISREMTEKQKKEKEGDLETKTAINKVAEKILKEMEDYEREERQSKNPRSKGTSKRTPGKTRKDVH